jgi:hypothetical protein
MSFQIWRRRYWKDGYTLLKVAAVTFGLKFGKQPESGQHYKSRSMRRIGNIVHIVKMRTTFKMLIKVTLQTLVHYSSRPFSYSMPMVSGPHYSSWIPGLWNEAVNSSETSETTNRHSVIYRQHGCKRTTLNSISLIQGGSNMTGTDCVQTSHSLSRSYLNHLVQLSKNLSVFWGLLLSGMWYFTIYEGVCGFRNLRVEVDSFLRIVGNLLSSQATSHSRRPELLITSVRKHQISCILSYLKRYLRCSWRCMTRYHTYIKQETYNCPSKYIYVCNFNYIKSGFSISPSAANRGRAVLHSLVGVCHLSSVIPNCCWYTDNRQSTMHFSRKKV